MINQANTLINGVEASSLSSADKRVNGIWICLAVFYHQLVMEFAPTYSFDLDFPAPFTACLLQEMGCLQ
jgi:hypothetical protein